MTPNEADALRIKLALLAIAIQADSTYEKIQKSEVNLPEVLVSNEKGRRPMTKQQLETLIDSRSASAIRIVEQRIKELQIRCSDLEKELARVKATCVVTTQT